MVITVAQYAKYRGVNTSRIRQLIGKGRFGDAVYHPMKADGTYSTRWAFTSVEAADAQLEATHNPEKAHRIKAPTGPRPAPTPAPTPAPAPPIERPAAPAPTPAPAPRPAPGVLRLSDMDPETMSVAQANRMKAVELALAAGIKRRAAEVELAKTQGQVIDVDEAGAEVEELLAGVVSALEGIPARIAQDCPEASPAVLDAVRRCIDDVRRDLAEG